MIRRSFLLAAALTLTAPAFAQSPQLAQVLSQLDAASARFHSARADFRWDYYERVVHDTTTQTGIIYFERSGPSISMGAVVNDPGKKVLDYHNGQLQMFDPGVDQITVMHAGANQAQYEGFLTLGFGGSGRDLAKAWNINDLGPETLSDGGHPVKCEKLDLTGKDPSVKNNFSHVTIWVDPARGVSLKQVFYAPGGDTRTAIYSNIQLNGSINHAAFAIKKDKKTTVVNR